MDIKKVIFLGCLAVSAGSAVANIVLTDFSQKQAIEVRRPVMNDTIAPDGSKFDVANLLKSSIVVDFSDSFEAMADTAGVVSLKRPDKNAAIHMLQTQIRAEKFLKGKLNVESTARFEVISGLNHSSKFKSPFLFFLRSIKFNLWKPPTLRSI